MTCTTCGRENPPHLTFCQECGQRLGPRVAPPTPPIGLGGGDAAPANVQTSLGGVAPALTTTPKKCRVCETMNAAGLRYCTSCGSTLEQSQSSADLAPRLSPHAATIAMPVPRRRS